MLLGREQLILRGAWMDYGLMWVVQLQRRAKPRAERPVLQRESQIFALWVCINYRNSYIYYFPRRGVTSHEPTQLVLVSQTKWTRVAICDKT